MAVKANVIPIQLTKKEKGLLRLLRIHSLNCDHIMLYFLSLFILVFKKYANTIIT